MFNFHYLIKMYKALNLEETKINLEEKKDVVILYKKQIFCTHTHTCIYAH